MITKCRLFLINPGRKNHYLVPKIVTFEEDRKTKGFIVNGKLYSIWQRQVEKGRFEEDVWSNWISWIHFYRFLAASQFLS